MKYLGIPAGLPAYEFSHAFIVYKYLKIYIFIFVYFQVRLYFVTISFDKYSRRNR